MNLLIPVIWSFNAITQSQPPQAVQTFERYLASLPDPSSNPISVSFKIKFASSRKGKQIDSSEGAGRLVLNAWNPNVVSVGEALDGSGLPLGEASSSKSKSWFLEFRTPARLMPFVHPRHFLQTLMHQLPLKSIEDANPASPQSGEKVLVFRLEAPRPEAKLWKFEIKEGEARIHIRGDGSVIGIKIHQAYSGRLNPHFGPYSLKRTEEWTFGPGVNGVGASRYRIHVIRQDWKEFLTAEAEVAREEAP